MSLLVAFAKKTLGVTRLTVERLHLVPVLRPAWHLMQRGTNRWAHLMTQAGLLRVAAPQRKVVQKLVEVEVMPRFVPPDTPDIFVPIGQKLSLGESIYLPVVLFDDTLGIDGDRDELVTLAAELQLIFHDFRPIFLTMSNDLAVFRRYGYMVEYLMGEERWLQLDHDLGWGQYRRDRLNHIAVFHRVRRVVPLSAVRQLRDDLVSPLRSQAIH